ncbi:HD-GYP domain-containing protein [Tumebacillus permanentifrigoris]|uniref:Putative nucleotidyltransferase with HDIG domain n=1 Tax=Tumebacillus permanentifrigoris TaxID=378543 RepID=A0A316DCR5_9BACL|nr:HD-GYP domain-containing protein [Tumebacillus permanentifrigoris]PWK15476.1 putative nucleotidyltransferase with HDIG domain [Tumebacillus permanentifrigoris]
MIVQERKVYVTRLQPGAVLSRDVYNERGQLILPQGTEMTTSLIVRLKQMATIEVWVAEHMVGPSAPLPTESPVPTIITTQPKPSLMDCYSNLIGSVENLFLEARAERRINFEPTRRLLRELAEISSKESNFLHLIINLRTIDEYTFQHSIGVGLLSMQIGEWMGLGPLERQELLIGGTLHDIGKCQIDAAILQKPSRLTMEEYEIVKHHARYGYEILRNSGVDERVAVAAYEHHERNDGSGYPRGLQHDQISRIGRIVAVADVFNAMTSRRVYKDALSYYRVLDEVQNNAFGALDPAVVALFVRKMTSFFVGNQVVLNDGTDGIVVLVPNDRPTRPLVRTATGFVDLLQRSDLYIQEVRAI